MLSTLKKDQNLRIEFSDKNDPDIRFDLSVNNRQSRYDLVKGL